MLTWRKFADEVPTEARCVIIGGVGSEDMDVYAPHQRGGLRWDNQRGDNITPAMWREWAERGVWTHWAYIDPPEDS